MERQKKCYFRLYILLHVVVNPQSYVYDTRFDLCPSHKKRVLGEWAVDCPHPYAHVGVNLVWGVSFCTGESVVRWVGCGEGFGTPSRIETQPRLLVWCFHPRFSNFIELKPRVQNKSSSLSCLQDVVYKIVGSFCIGITCSLVPQTGQTIGRF